MKPGNLTTTGKLERMVGSIHVMLQTRCWALGLCGPAALEFQSKGEMHWKGPTHHPSDKCGRSPGSILKEQDVKRWRGFKAGR